MNTILLFCSFFCILYAANKIGYLNGKKETEKAMGTLLSYIIQQGIANGYLKLDENKIEGNRIFWQNGQSFLTAKQKKILSGDNNAF